MKYVGVDGCPAGWFVVSLTDHNVDCTVFETFRELWEAHGDAHTIMVDIPMGLPGGNQPPRAADRLAREMLGPRRSSVFLPSVREVLSASSYREACEINRQLTGKKISKQYWYLVPKIQDVDSLLQDEPGAVKVLRESHPELCFWLASGGTIQHSKKTGPGLEERLTVLRKYLNNTGEIYGLVLRKYLRKEVARDDVVDAMVLAVAARLGEGEIHSLPNPPEQDETGLPMAIWYPDFGQDM
ncbi:DUF429 domain-containing protein [Pseudodesulfovibrio sp. zrk46]|uniref:DUF429 domain-containing protein n=1 Tax=Pseudodesulfovibrio sp. zrk46 TaxID=2725288 RepID=UPI001448D4DF|nr:DUF429 domain-containing protein [Pseudodesulfovibrio sp. zrk46]QJB56083.1 DUF429 domain-containing protein [Pseudodesulfovibrio sp. zrk46]